MRVRASILTIAALVVGFAVHTSSAHAVVGGSPALITSYPWMTQLELQEDGEKTTFCGGTLIAPRVVLTAAHCLVGVERDTRAVLGRQAFTGGALALVSGRDFLGLKGVIEALVGRLHADEELSARPALVFRCSAR